MNITGNAAIDVLIGIFFFYFVLSVVCSAINEVIATVLGLRAKTLEKGIANLLGSGQVESFYAHPRIKTLLKPEQRVLKFLSNRPSYVPARAFALTVLDLFTKPGDHGAGFLARAEAPVATAPAAIKRLFADAVTEAQGDEEKFRSAVETSFNEVMDRTSGWYKRQIQLILFLVGLALVCAINADSFSFSQRLWKNDSLRASVVAQAQQAVKAKSTTSCSKSTSPPQEAADCIEKVKQLGLPFGWSSATSPHSVWDGVGKFFGLLVTVFALSLGAPFWFDLLGKVSQLRNSGPAPGDKNSANQPSS